MPSLTIENYVKTIYQITAAQGGAPAATGQVAAALEVSPGTVSSMLKALHDSRLVNYAPYEGVGLTLEGEKLALRIIRRHRLIELFLVKTLNLTWDEVHDEAEHMEHAVSDFLIDRIDAFLGHPEVDPHGDPIPTREGTVEQPLARSLAEYDVGKSFRLARVIDQSPEFLRFLTESGLALGTRGEIVSRRGEAGTVTVRTDDGETTLGLDAADRIWVTPTDSPSPSAQ